MILKGRLISKLHGGYVFLVASLSTEYPNNFENFMIGYYHNELWHNFKSSFQSKSLLLLYLLVQDFFYTNSEREQLKSGAHLN